MNCVICNENIENVKDYNVFKNNSHIINEYVICDKCLNHIANGGKFVRVDSLALNVDSFGENKKIVIGLFHYALN